MVAQLLDTINEEDLEWSDDVEDSRVSSKPPSFRAPYCMPTGIQTFHTVLDEEFDGVLDSYESGESAVSSRAPSLKVPYCMTTAMG